MRIYRDNVINKDYYYYSPNEIIFTRDQCLFLLEHWLMLSQGKYPSEPSGDFTEVSAVSAIRPNWKSAENIHAELEYRLDKAGDAGIELLCCTLAGLDRYESLPPIARGALNYISGWRRRRMSYADWLRQEKYRGKYE